MIINISSVNLFLECQRKWGYRVLEHSEPETQAMADGTLWHDCCAKGTPPPETAPQWMHAAWEAHLAWHADHPDIEFLGNEVELEAPFGSHTLKGRLDGIVKWNGLYWHWQHKTVPQGKNLALYSRLIARSFHEHGYRHLAIHAGYEPYGGSWLECARKLSNAALDRGEGSLFVTPLPTTANNAGLLRDLETHIDRMAEWESRILAGGELPPQVPDACGGFHGNSPCHFLDVCDDRVGLAALTSRHVPLLVRKEPAGGPGDVVPPAA